jgi:hypothetical protein
MILQRTHFLSFGEELQLLLLDFVVVRAISEVYVPIPSDSQRVDCEKCD